VARDRAQCCHARAQHTLTLGQRVRNAGQREHACERVIHDTNPPKECARLTFAGSAIVNWARAQSNDAATSSQS